MSNDFWEDDSTPVQRAPKAKPKRDQVRAVRRDSFDRVAWEQALGNTPVLREQVTALEVDFITSPAAYEDLFNLLNQGAPLFHGEQEVVDEYVPQYEMLRGAYEHSEEFNQLRRHTIYDQYKTITAMVDMADAFRKAFEDLQKWLEEHPPFCPWPPEGGGGDGPGGEPGQPGDGPGDDGTEEGPEEGGGGPGKYPVEIPSVITDALVMATHDATQQLNEEAALITSYGVDDGQLQRMSYEERRGLMDRLDDAKLRKFANMLGGFRLMGDAERRRKILHAPAEVVDVKFGNDLTKLIPQELNNLAIPELEEMFWIRYARHALMLKETRGVERAGKGPIIVVCDESDSMSDPVDVEGNTREMWSKAVSLALCDQAKRDKRDFIYIGFSSKNQQYRVDFPGGVAPIWKVIEFVEHFFAGGTHYETPLQQAMEIVDGYLKASKPCPDVVFITDGQCRVSSEFISEWREMRDRADARCYGFQIGGDPYAHQMKDLVDRSVSLSKLNANPEGVADLFRTV